MNFGPSLAPESLSDVRVPFADSSFIKRCCAAYLRQNRRMWSHLAPSLGQSAWMQAYGRHLHRLARQLDRRQSFGTFFLRNRPELDLFVQLMDDKPSGAEVAISVLACSKGAEVYSIVWRIRSARPDLRISVFAVDISREIVEFAERGVYARNDLDTERDQVASIFTRMTPNEMAAFFDREGEELRVRSWLREQITWVQGDANSPELGAVIGRQDFVVANRFLCHMKPDAAERCLRNIARLVKPGGYLFASGVDLDIRVKVARTMGWKPVTSLIREIHEGDYSLRDGWPLEYWGLEPLSERWPDWQARYASVFQIG